MDIRSQNKTIHYSDIADLRGISESRAKAIFREVGRLAGVPAYSPRTWEDYRKWERKKIEERKARNA